MYDVVIIGNGPAGVSASLYTSRANLKTLIISKNDSLLQKTDKIENYYGFALPISGKDLLFQGQKQAERLGVEFIEEEVVSIEKNDTFEVRTTNSSYLAKSVLLSTGQRQKKINIENLQIFEGKGISYCTTCDGFFYKGRKVGVLGYKDFVIHEAIELLTFTKDIIIFTNGMDLEISEKYKNELEKFKIITKPVKKIDGDEAINKIIFADDSIEPIDGLFIAYESASSIDFARKLGVLIDGNSVVVDNGQKTNLDGLFAAGDCTGGFKQISVAVGQGAIAGSNIIKYIKSGNK
jgi:thioredoxin reductase (NADPH)